MISSSFWGETDYRPVFEGKSRRFEKAEAHRNESCWRARKLRLLGVGCPPAVGGCIFLCVGNEMK